MFLTENIGLRLQASVTTPWVLAGGGMDVGVGGGGASVGGAATFGISIAHWDLSAGVIFRIRN